jgi:hypothetical protein
MNSGTIHSKARVHAIREPLAKVAGRQKQIGEVLIADRSVFPAALLELKSNVSLVAASRRPQTAQVGQVLSALSQDDQEGRVPLPLPPGEARGGMLTLPFQRVKAEKSSTARVPRPRR